MGSHRVGHDWSDLAATAAAARKEAFHKCVIIKHQCYIYKVIEMNITSEYCISGGCLFKVLRITSGVLKVKVTILSGLPGMVIQKHACLLGSACLFTY